MDEATQKLKVAILLLENMDDIMLDLCREPSIASVEAELRVLEVSRDSYRHSSFAAQDMVDYLVACPSLKRNWLSVTRRILNMRHNGVTDSWSRAWRLKTKQLQDAGDEAWRAAAGTNAISEYGSAIAVNALTAKFRVVDDLLNSLYESLQLGTRESFGDEYNDTLLAIINIQQGAGDRSTSLTTERIDMYKSELRARHRAPRLNLVDTSTKQTELSTVESNISDQNQMTTDTASSISTTQSAVRNSAKFNPTTSSITLILTFASSLFTIWAWQYSTPSHGTISDADFWFLLQSCVIQLAGLFPVGIQLWISTSGPVQPSLWSWIFVAGSLLCSVTLPILYCFVPTAIGSLVAFSGSVLQVFVVMEALVVTEKSAAGKVHQS